jgi:hypothetical protein
VNQSFVDHLINADYGRYHLTDMATRTCIYKAGYAVRDAVLEAAHQLGQAAACDELYTFACGTAAS